MYTTLRKTIPAFSSKPKQPSVSHFFMDNRPGHVAQTKCCNEIQNSFRNKLANDFQTPSEPDRLKRPFDHSISPIQRAPVDFQADPVLGIEGIGKIFHNWRNLQDRIREYAGLQPAQLYERIKKLKEIKAAVQKWKEANSRKTTPDSETKRGALITLESKLRDEIQEIQDTEYRGKLSPGPGEPASIAVPVADDPLLTIPNQQKKDKEHFGFFKPGARLCDKDGNPIGSPPVEGQQCLLTGNSLYKVHKLPGDITAIATPFKFPSGISEAFVKSDQVLVTSVTMKKPDTHYSTDYQEAPLFPTTPSPADVEQNGLGDCYLLGAMIALAKTDPNHIVNMMIDNLDGTVTVRLYETSTFPFQPLFVRVKKTLVKGSNGKDAFAGGALWVSLLEKAYVAAHFTANSPESLPSQKSSYGIIAAGESTYAMQHLLGRKSQQTQIVIPSGWEMYQSAYEQIAQTLSTPISSSNDITDLMLACIKSPDGKKIYNARMNHETLSTLFIQPSIVNDPNYTNWQSFITWITAEVPGKRGTGNYRPEELQLFVQIATSIDQNKPVVINTNAFPISHAQGLNQENTGKGLAGLHAYAVLDFKPKPLPHLIPPGQLCWLQLRNPWGDLSKRLPSNPTAGRAYWDKTDRIPLQVPYDTPVKTGTDYHLIEARPTPEPEFWIELTDVTKKFSSFDTL